MIPSAPEIVDDGPTEGRHVMPSRPIPPRPSLEFDRKQARALLDALREGDPAAMQRLRSHHSRFRAGEPTRAALHDTQLVIAREYGFTSWPRWKQFVEARQLDAASVPALLVHAASHGDMRKASTLLAADPALERIQEAVAHAGHALDLSRVQKERGWEARTRHLLGAIAAARDPLDAETVDNHYRDARTLGAELGMSPLVAHCHLGLGPLYARTGRRAEARQHLAVATRMYGEMDMRFWLDKAEAERAGIT
jgi:hypothetical protein